jgi:exosortase/archaeosortase family protein
VLALVHENVRVIGERVFLGSSAVEIVNSCTGVDVGVFLASAMLVFPASWRMRAQGVVAAFAIVLAVNFVRVLTLCWLNDGSPQAFSSCTSTSGPPSSPASVSRRCWAGSSSFPSAMRRSALILLARFALIYGLLVWLCASVPVYAWIEHVATRVAAPLLREHAMQARSLRFEQRGDASVYVYELRVGAVERVLERPFHRHAFVLVLYLALVLATPGLRPGQLALALLGGGALVFLLCVAMLMSDLALWESDALAAAGLGDVPGPWAVPLGFMAGLHRTAAAGLLPVILWVLLASPQGALRARTPPATSRA